MSKGVEVVSGEYWSLLMRGGNTYSLHSQGTTLLLGDTYGMILHGLQVIGAKIYSSEYCAFWQGVLDYFGEEQVAIVAMSRL